MPPHEAARYRRCPAKIKYLSQDRPDISYAWKELSRSMSKPMVGDEVKLKRVVRYLSRQPRWVFLYGWQEPTWTIDVFSDSDWGGCTRTRKSTSGGILLRGKHALLHWSRTQQLIALSSAEAELNASISAGCDGLGVKHMAAELGTPHNVQLHGDSSANHGIAHRAGCGRIKHLEIRQLWLQERVHLKDLAFATIPRLKNISDTMTHHWTAPESKIHFGGMHAERRGLDNGTHVKPEGGS